MKETFVFVSFFILSANRKRDFRAPAHLMCFTHTVMVLCPSTVKYVKIVADQSTKLIHLSGCFFLSWCWFNETWMKLFTSLLRRQYTLSVCDVSSRKENDEINCYSSLIHFSHDTLHLYNSGSQYNQTSVNY